MLKKTIKGINFTYKKLKDQLADVKKELHQEELEVQQLRGQKKEVKKAQHVVVDFSVGTILKILLLVFLAAGVVQIAGLMVDILVILFLAFILTSAFDPLVDRLEDYHIPRFLTILICYVIILGLLSWAIAYYTPILASQLVDLAKNIGKWINDITTNGISDIPFFDRLEPHINFFLQSVTPAAAISSLQQTLSGFANNLTSLTTNTVKAVFSVFGGFISALIVLVLTFYMVVDRDGLSKFVRSLLPAKYEEYAITRIEKVREKMGAWVRGQLLLCLLIGGSSYMVLTLLGIKFAASLALLAGVMELVPIAGFFISGIPAVLIALFHSPWSALGVLIAYIVIAGVEANILVPLIMRKAVGLSPIVVILALIIGGKLLGVIGILIAVPIVTTAAVFLSDYQERQRGGRR